MVLLPSKHWHAASTVDSLPLNPSNNLAKNTPLV